MIRFSTAGESHGEALIALVSGIPAGVPVDLDFVNRELWRRQQGYGRGGRMKIETDQAHILSGVRHGKTIGSPIAIQLINRDWKNWQEKLPVETGDPAKHRAVTSPDPATPTLPAHSNSTSPTRATSLSAPLRASPPPALPPEPLPSCSFAAWESKSQATSFAWAASSLTATRRGTKSRPSRQRKKSFSPASIPPPKPA
jgi:hypothetical protein